MKARGNRNPAAWKLTMAVRELLAMTASISVPLISLRLLRYTIPLSIKLRRDETAVTKKLLEQGELPKFLQTTPVGKDLFEGQAQENSAAAIARLIEDGGPQSKLIGLDGAWGSGKSNLIGIVKSKLATSHHFFVYDSWGHQEDLHRRSFLEELTSDLCASRLVKPKIWKKKLRELLSEKRETLTRTIPRLSDGVIMAAFVAIFTPIAQSFGQEIVNPYVSWLVKLIPVSIGVAIYGIASYKKGSLLGLREFFSIYGQEELTNEVHESVYEAQPTVRQFQDWMRGLGNALKKKKGLVIVFDNMDRLPPDKLRELWSSIHTFFAESSYESIWALVPFDRNHIAKAFGKKRGSELSEEFLRKSFSVVFRVPSPVMTDWHRFFEQKFDEAFKDEAEERLVVRKIFGQSNMEVTPRSIIAFINELVAVRFASKEAIPLRYVAIFVINRKRILEDPVGRILGGGLVGYGASALEADPEFADSIAALTYGVPLASASQVALHREIQSVVERRDCERLLYLSKHPAFLDVFEHLVKSGKVAVAESIAAVESIEGTDLGQRCCDRIRSIWDEIYVRELYATVSEQRFSGTYRSLLVHISDQLRPAFVGYLVKGYAEVRENSFSGKGYFSALSDLHKCVQENGMPIDVFAMLGSQVVNASIFNDFVRCARSEYRRFRLSCDPGELQQFLIEHSQGKWQQLGSTSHLADLAGEYDLAPVVVSLESRLTSGSLSSDDVAPLYELYKAISPKRPLNLPDFQLVARLFSELGEESPSLPHLLAMALVNSEQMGSLRGTRAHLVGSHDASLADKVARCIEDYEEYGVLLVNGLKRSSPLMKLVLSKLTHSTNEHTISNIAEVLVKYDNLYGYLNTDPDAFIRKLDRCGKTAIEEVGTMNFAELLEQALLFEHAMAVECKLTRQLVEKAIEWYASLDVDSWQGIYTDRSSKFRVFCLLLESRNLDRIPANADTAFRDFLVQFVRGGVDMDADEWSVIYRKSDKRRLKPIAKNIRDEFISSVDMTPPKFKFLSDILFTYSDLNARSGDVARKILAPVATDPECLEIILGGRDSIQIIKSAGDDASALKDIIRERSMEAGASDELKKFSKRIGV